MWCSGCIFLNYILKSWFSNIHLSVLILAGMEDLQASLEKCMKAMKEEHGRLSQLHADKERAKADFDYLATKVKSN